MAHAVGAYELQTGKRPESPFEFEDHGEHLIADIPDEMREHVAVYVDEVRRDEADYGILFVEQHVDLSDFVRDQMFGTADAIVVQPQRRRLIVTDFKYGYMPVPLTLPEWLLDGHQLEHLNTQLLYYAAGAAHANGWDLLDEVVLKIVQPRSMEVPPIQTASVDPRQLREWATNILWQAAHAATSADAPLCAGEWCRFCPALDVCPAAQEVVQTSAAIDFAEVVITPEVPDDIARLAKLLTWAPHIDAWLRACEARALELMRHGNVIPGQKLVEKRTHRAWPVEDPATLAKMLNANLPKEKMIRGDALMEKSLMSPAKAEKLVGKKAVGKVAIHPPGDLTIAPTSSRKPAVDPISDFEELNI